MAFPLVEAGRAIHSYACRPYAQGPVYVAIANAGVAGSLVSGG